MKVKNIAFSGFAAAILATGAARADVPQIASKTYVDKVETKVDNLTTTLVNNYTTTENLGGVITTNITQALENDTSAISAALADKEDSSNKVNAINKDNKDSADAFPTVGAVTSYVKEVVDSGVDIDTDQIAAGAITADKLAEDSVSSDAIADGAVTTPKIANKNVTAEKLSDELNAKIDAAQSASDVAAAIATAISSDTGAIKQALDEKVDAEQVDAAIKEYTIPVPKPECAAESGRCLLSVGPDGKLTWVEVTAPAE